MKATMESTSKMIILNGMNFRVWEGVTENGVGFILLANRIETLNVEQKPRLLGEVLKAHKPSSAAIDAALDSMGLGNPAAAASSGA